VLVHKRDHVIQPPVQTRAPIIRSAAVRRLAIPRLLILLVLFYIVCARDLRLSPTEHCWHHGYLSRLRALPVHVSLTVLSTACKYRTIF
jgi:hypothetical protein